MKMVKSLLLVSAASIVAASGAQAADLPVKAKPVEYVKVCSLYGAGFYYVPGTDICMKVGGYIRFQQDFGMGSNISAGPLNGAGGRMTRTDSQDYAMRTRAVATFDTRQQTAYGTLRTYLLMGFQQDSTVAPSTAPNVYMTRGFVQLAGFTFGKATSFFDFVSTAAVAYNAGFNYAPDTGDAGQMVAAYTAQFGNGLSATISAEQSRRVGTVNTEFQGSGANGASNYNLASGNPNPDNLGGIPGGTTAGVGLTDIVGNIRIDQAWGSAQVSAALHDARAGYYTSAANGAILESNGHPDDKWGWAVSAGLRLNAPMIGPGDYFQGAVVYSEGAIKYAAVTPSGSALNIWNGNSMGFGFFEDGVFTNPGGVSPSVQLTTAWSVFASYEHFWTPSLRTSIYGSYIDVSHNAAGNAAICTSFIGNGTGQTGNPFSTSDAACNANWSSYTIGTRSQWNITKDLYVGLDVLYAKLNSAQVNAAGTATLPAIGAKPAGVYAVQDQDAWTATWRVQRDIVP